MGQRAINSGAMKSMRAWQPRMIVKIVFDQADAVGRWVGSRTGLKGTWGDFYAIGIEDDGRIVAGVVINNYNGANATCHIAIGKQTRLLLDLFRYVGDYAFNHCGLKRLTGMVPTNEPRVIEFDKHLGFEEEFVMKDGAPGADMVVLVMRADSCRWLKKG
jgi:RimJ/RimL family protein N-acetyltransferase